MSLTSKRTYIISLKKIILRILYKIITVTIFFIKSHFNINPSSIKKKKSLTNFNQTLQLLKSLKLINFFKEL